MNLPPKIRFVLKNKYLITLTLFVVWMIFFDPKDVGSSLSRHKRLNELLQSEKDLQKQIDETNRELGLLKNSAETIERYARENYYMKKDNEDLFIVKTP